MENPRLSYTQMPLQRGGVLNFRELPQGVWSSDEAKHHINYLEMLAIKLGLKCFEEKIRQQHVKLMVDNMTAVTILNNMGTSHSWELNELN